MPFVSELMWLELVSLGWIGGDVVFMSVYSTIDRRCVLVPSNDCDVCEV